MNNIHFEEGRNAYKKVLNNIKYDLKQDIIISGQVQSLEHISLTKIAINLFKCDLRVNVDKFFNSIQSPENYAISFCNLLKLVESNAHAKCASLNLTSPCKDSLKQIIMVIQNEIFEFFSQHLSLTLISVRDAKEIILIYYAHLCWTQEGKINIIKTMVNIIENSNLDPIGKYILACDNCLEDKIQSLLNILPANLINDLIKADNENDERSRKFVLVTFWTYRSRGEQAKFSELINGEETYQYLLNWTIKNKKKLAWHYFWENFADDEMKDQNLKLVVENEYISLSYLLTQMDLEKIEDLFNLKVVGIFFVNMLDRISKSCKIVLVLYYILDYIATKAVCDSYEIIKYSWENQHININEHIKIWEDFMLFINDDDSEDITETIHEYLYESLFILKDWNVFKVLVKFSTYQTKKDFLYESDYWFEFCQKFLMQVPEHFNKIIKLLLVSEEEISKFNKILFSDSIFDDIIISNLIKNDKFEILKQVLLMYCSTEEINKSELPFKNNASIILKILKGSKDSNLLNMLNKFISWCYDENNEEVTKCKAEIFDLKTQLYVEHKKKFFNNFQELVRMKKWDLVNKFGMWIFFATKDNIDSIEKKMKGIKNIFYHSSRDDYCLLLKNFIISFFDQKENNDIKEMFTNNIILVVVKNLINLDSHEEADKLLDWRFSSHKKDIAKFKDLFMSIKGHELLLEYIENWFDILKVDAFFKWFNPSLESAKIFKEGFLKYIVNKRNSNNWDIISLRTNKTLAFLLNYVEEANLIDKEDSIKIEDNVETKNFGKKRENDEFLFEERKKIKLF